MNIVPDTYVRVAPDAIRGFVARIARHVGMGETNALLLAELLTQNDLRGVFSHGSRQIATYAKLLRDGILNPQPDVRIANDGDTTIVVD
ncbi:MAG: hypothetical protein K0Q59_3200, partial [Paenibacillus sp.]|nr:hypothetical protein [Paenibacillus sp.]